MVPFLTLLAACTSPGSAPGAGFGEVRPGAFQATLGDFDALIGPAGLEASARHDHIALQLSSYGREGDLALVPEATPSLVSCPPRRAFCEPRVELVRPHVTEWWIERGGSLEQGFELDTPPAGTGPLELVLDLHGATPQETEQGAAWRTPRGDPWRYQGLDAFDDQREVVLAPE